MIISSDVFRNGETILRKYTCDDENVSPPLYWEKVPVETVSLVIICEDPDAPSKVWTHWLIFNLPSSLEGLEEGVDTVSSLKNGAIQGLNDSGTVGYSGPCPPGGVHRYFFKLYALDIKLDLDAGSSKEDILRAMEGHILDRAELMGLYSR